MQNSTILDIGKNIKTGSLSTVRRKELLTVEFGCRNWQVMSGVKVVLDRPATASRSYVERMVDSGSGRSMLGRW